jgi:mono/diheme cytochrome c family protein
MNKFFAASCCLAGLLFAAACAAHRDAAAAVPPPTPAPEVLIAEGQARFMAYKCHECHGAHGEGTDDAPDLTGTHLDADGIALFLQKPSAHARSIGMPSIPADSPDLQPLAAFVLSLKPSR